jgi:DNA-binding response OmpR family regulator
VKSILIASNDYSVSDFLCRSLGFLGYETVPLYDEDEMNSVIEGRDWELALVDLDMEYHISWIKRIKTAESSLPLIGFVKDIDAAKVAPGTGVDCIVSKPFDADEVLAKVEHYIR